MRVAVPSRDYLIIDLPGSLCSSLQISLYLSRGSYSKGHSPTKFQDFIRSATLRQRYAWLDVRIGTNSPILPLQVLGAEHGGVEDIFSSTP